MANEASDDDVGLFPFGFDWWSHVVGPVEFFTYTGVWKMSYKLNCPHCGVPHSFELVEGVHKLKCCNTQVCGKYFLFATSNVLKSTQVQDDEIKYTTQLIANDHQIGGDHYKRVPGEQHWDRAPRIGLNYHEACATAYVERCRFKGHMRQDLRKAAHFIHKLLELMDMKYPNYTPLNPEDPDFVAPVKPEFVVATPTIPPAEQKAIDDTIMEGVLARSNSPTK